MANKSYKGRRFEIWLASELSKWWSGGERDDIFWHTHDSGGRATRRRLRGKSTKGLCGDICAVDQIGQPLLDLITFEAKNGYSKHTIADLLDKPEGAAKQLYEKWIDQARNAKEAAGTPYWMLVVKRDRREPLVFMEDDELYGFWFPALLTLEVVWPFALIGTTLSKFFGTVTPNDVRKLKSPAKKDCSSPCQPRGNRRC